MYLQINLSLVFLASTLAVDIKENCVIREFIQVEDVVESCTDIKVSNLHVPANTKLILNLKNGTHLIFEGRTYFDFFEWEGPLIVIKGNYLNITGEPGSVLDGQGELYWDSYGGIGGITKPQLITLEVTNSIIEHINVKNCPVHCVYINYSENLIINDWNVDVSEGDKKNFTGHNTDGFGITGTNIVLTNSIVRNQDDCVVVNAGTDILVSNMLCYGGHGLSISAGFSPDFEKNAVYNVTFENSLVDTSPNGIHVKTHADSGPGIVKNVTYRNIEFKNIHNFALNIQQDYVNGEATGKPGTNIPIIDLTLENIRGNMQSYDDSPTLEALIICGEGSCSSWTFSGIDIIGAINGSYCNYEPEGYSCPDNNAHIAL